MINIKLNGSRGGMLIGGGLYATIRGFAYLPTVLPAPNYVPDSLTLIAAIIPISVWGFIWLTIGVICFIFAFKRKDSLAWSLLVAIGFAWGASLLISTTIDFIHGEDTRDYIGATSYLWAAALAMYVAGKVPDRV